MDAFYASVEQRDHPELRGRPVAVGGGTLRSVVAAASYESRRFGINSAMPMVRARRLCPDLVVVPPRFDVYRDVSRRLMTLFRGYTPLVEPLSLDEAFLDVAGATRLFGPPVEIAQRIRADVREQVSLPCSIGVGPSKFVAKLLSAHAKPDGVAHWPADEVRDRLRPLPVSALWGAGPRTVERLRDYGFVTVGDVADADPRTLTRVIGDANAAHLRRLARAEDSRRVVPHEPAKSVSAEETYEEDLDDPEALRRRLLHLSEKVAARLRRSGVAGRTITLKVRFTSFETITRSRTLDAPTDRTHDLVTTVWGLLDDLRLERAQVRLLGVGVSNLGDGAAARQMTLDADQRWEDVDLVADRVRDRFGDVRVSFAALLDDDEGIGDQAPSADDRQ